MNKKIKTVSLKFDANKVKTIREKMEKSRLEKLRQEREARFNHIAFTITIFILGLMCGYAWCFWHFRDVIKPVIGG